jgi:hypothetical protein
MAKEHVNSMATVVEPTWTYQEAALILGHTRQTISELARAHKIIRPAGRPLDEKALRQLARLLNVKVKFARSA